MNSSRLSWANDLRAFATIAVIMLHVVSTILIQYPTISKTYLYSSLLIDSSLRWCVPVFIMLSGCFALEQYDGRFKVFFIKLFYRIILPFLFWSIVYLLYFSYNEMNDLHKNAGQLFSFIGKQFLSGTASHLWFVYIIVSLYLSFPLLSKWTKGAVKKEYIYFLSIWIITLLLDACFADYDTNWDLNFFSGYLGYVILGNYLFKVHTKINGLILFMLFGMAVLYTGIRTYFISIDANTINEAFMENLSLNVCLMSFCVFLFFKNSQFFIYPVWRKLIDIICLHSYGIYLSHLLILNIFLSVGLSFSFIHPLLSIPLISFACLVISFTLVIMMKKIPFLRDLAG